MNLARLDEPRDLAAVLLRVVAGPANLQLRPRRCRRRAGATDDGRPIEVEGGDDHADGKVVRLCLGLPGRAAALGSIAPP